MFLFLRGFYSMEMGQDKKVFTSDVKKTGSIFLSSFFNADENSKEIKKIITTFHNKVKELTDDKEARAVIMTYYGNVMELLLQLNARYELNITDFEDLVLKLNSVISTSLTIEYRLHDTIFDEDLLSKSPMEKDTMEMLNKILVMADEIDNKTSKICNDEIKALKEKVLSLKSQYKEQIKKDQRYTARKNHFIQVQKNNEYYIANVSKNENFTILLKGVLLYYISNELIDEVRDYIFKKQNIAIKKPHTKKEHCLNVNVLDITQTKFAKIIELSVQNTGQVVIERKALELVRVFIDLQNLNKNRRYQETLKKHIKTIIEELTDRQAILPKNMLMSTFTNNAKKILKEMGWRNY